MGLDEKPVSNESMGKKMIEIALGLDESLVEILKIEVKRLKQLAKCDNVPEELKRTNNLVRNIIIALALTDEKIKTGIDLCLSDADTKN